MPWKARRWETLDLPVRHRLLPARRHHGPFRVLWKSPMLFSLLFSEISLHLWYIIVRYTWIPCFYFYFLKNGVLWASLRRTAGGSSYGFLTHLLSSATRQTRRMRCRAQTGILIGSAENRAQILLGQRDSTCKFLAYCEYLEWIIGVQEWICKSESCCNNSKTKNRDSEINKSSLAGLLTLNC